MGNSNLEEARLKEADLEVFKYSNFYGRHEQSADFVIKKYELFESEKDAFLGLIHSYQKINHPGLITIEDIHLVKQINDKYFYELSFPYYPQTLTSQIISRKDKNPFSEKQILLLMLNLVEVILIFQEKQFPFGHLSPDKIALKNLDQGYCIGIQILMNSASIGDGKGTKDKRTIKFLSPQEIMLENYPNGFDRMKSVVFTLGLIALHAIVSYHFQYKQIEEIVFELRKNHSYQFCNFLKSMLYLDNLDRLSLQQCHQTCIDMLYQLKKDDEEIKENSFIRGYNCVESIWLFETRKQQAISDRWALKQRPLTK